jgi:[ribosomal protein S5]-alanine N-acetyltransferase
VTGQVVASDNDAMPRLVPSALTPGSLARLSQPVLDLQDCVVRPWQASDVRDVARAYAEGSIQRWHRLSLSEVEAREWIASWKEHWKQETGAGWAIASGSELLGEISLRKLRLGDGCSEVSSWILPSVRRRGLATRTLHALSTWAFDQLGLHRLELAHSTKNAVPCRIAGGAGYRLEGTKRREGLFADGWHDIHLHARLSDD